MELLGNLFVISAPSGAGKTSLVRALIAEVDHIVPSVSHTTRLPRPGEVDGVDYRFVSFEHFQHMIDSQIFLEHALVFENYYGTCRDWVCKQLSFGHDVILEIDWQGGKQIKQIFPACISVFILPPSIEALRERLEFRQQDSHDIIKRRMNEATKELRHLDEYDYIVINNEFSDALDDLKAIVQVARLTTRRQTSLHNELIKMLFLGKI
jgi:guanylate kinase